MNIDFPELQALWTCIVIAFAAASISITVTQTVIFAPIRTWADKANSTLGYLFQCFYCFCHWVVIAAVAFYRPTLLPGGNLIVGWLVSVFFTVTIATMLSGVMFKVFLVAMAKKVQEQKMVENSQK
ncbi:MULTISPECIES: hypothetical protein [unclassified Burkholderia]|uniref:hypothetical protein n=1 Tax=unclassified Burkholderia TaxID=2613784 RepID=UPI002AAF7D6E|nr:MULTISPECIES: hypothetical protein [unclassified Burkholderia]